MAEDPKVTIGGREFPVPELAIDQLETVFPAMGTLARIFNDPANALASFDSATFKLLLDTVFVGIMAGSPGFTMADFRKLKAKPMELVAAMHTIALQSGMATRKSEGATNGAGEAMAAGSSIGTESSPKSVALPDGAGTTSVAP